MQLNIKKLSFIGFALILVSCAKPIEVEELSTTENPILNETKNNIEEMVKDITPIAKESDNVLIEKALLKHYDGQFGCNDSDIKSTGFHMYRIEDGDPGTKKAYGFANYMEYNIDGDKVTPVCGSGPTAIAVTFNTGNDDYEIYEVLTDGDYQSQNFKDAFPEDIQDIILERKQSDIEDVNKKQKEMVKRLYKEITKKELTTTINDSLVPDKEDEE